jgi:hypothetical protein
MPSYEDEGRGFVVYDLQVVQFQKTGGAMLLSRWYGTAAIVAPEDLVPLHHSPEARWTYRPAIYDRSMHGYWRRLGSQTEIAWRAGLKQIQEVIYGEIEEQVQYLLHPPMEEANKRADKLLAENLNAFQAVEKAAHNRFRVRGGITSDIYEVQVGDGFRRVDPFTGEVVRSYCLHPEYWIPDADVALATKLSLESPELEMQTIRNARATPLQRRIRASDEDRLAASIECELIV